MLTCPEVSSRVNKPRSEHTNTHCCPQILFQHGRQCQGDAQTRGVLRAAARSHGAAAAMGQDGSIPMVKAVSMFSWSRAIEAQHLHWPPPPVLFPITGTFLQGPRSSKAKGSRGMIVWRISSTTGSTDWGHLAHGQNLPAPCLSNSQPQQHDFGPSLHNYINMISSQE